VPAAPRAEGQGESGRERLGARIARQREEAAAEAKAAAAAETARRAAEAPPPAVEIAEVYDRRVGNGSSGLYVDLVYKSTGLRAVRLFGRSDTAGAEQASEPAVAASAAARAYRAALAGSLPATTQLTG
jgi:hypothetical protein